MIALHRKYIKKSSDLYKTTKAFHMVSQGKWTTEANESEFTVYDDEGDKLMRIKVVNN